MLADYYDQTNDESFLSEQDKYFEPNYKESIKIYE